jgi:hypothetical protein
MYPLDLYGTSASRGEESRVIPEIERDNIQSIVTMLSQHQQDLYTMSALVAAVDAHSLPDHKRLNLMFQQVERAVAQTPQQINGQASALFTALAQRDGRLDSNKLVVLEYNAKRANTALLGQYGQQSSICMRFADIISHTAMALTAFKEGRLGDVANTRRFAGYPYNRDCILSPRAR